MSVTYETDEVQKVVFTTKDQPCEGGQCGPPPDTFQVPLDEDKPDDSEDTQENGDEQDGQEGENGDEEQQAQDQLQQEAQELMEGMEDKGTVGCGSIEASAEEQEGDLDFTDNIEADDVIQQIEDEVAEKGGEKHPFKSADPGKGKGGGTFELDIPEVKKMPHWVRLIKEFAEREFEKVRGKKDFDAPFSFAYGFVQRSKIRAPKFKKHMYIMACCPCQLL